MNQDIKDLWISALRSGRYRQGKGILREFGDNGLEFCCLGVLCDLYRLKTHKGKWVFSTFSFPDNSGHTFQLPKLVCKWAGLENPDPSVDFDSYRTTLSELSDQGLPFKEIANLINSQL